MGSRIGVPTADGAAFDNCSAQPFTDGEETAVRADHHLPVKSVHSPCRPADE